MLSPSISQAINNTVSSAPELKNDPGTAVAVGAAGGTPTKAQAVAQAGTRQANATAQDQVAQTGTDIFGDIADGAVSALSKVAHYANDGLSTVQHEYRYLHAVEATHGRTAAVMEGAGILAGMVAGTLVDPGEGTVLGAEAATYLEGQFAYKNLWNQTLNPNYKDPHTGQLVSFGRDVSSVLGLHGGAQTAVSGALDGLGDMIADPLGLVGKGLGEAHSVTGMGGLLGRTFQGTAITVENVDQAYDTLPSIRRAFSDIAGMTAGDIGFSYPQFKGSRRSSERQRPRKRCGTRSRNSRHPPRCSTPNNSRPSRSRAWLSAPCARSSPTSLTGRRWRDCRVSRRGMSSTTRSSGPGVGRTASKPFPVRRSIPQRWTSRGRRSTPPIPAV